MISLWQGKIVCERFSGLKPKPEDSPQTWYKVICLRDTFYEYEPSSSSPNTERDAYKKHVNNANETACLTMTTMNSEFQKQHEKMLYQ